MKSLRGDACKGPAGKGMFEPSVDAPLFLRMPFLGGRDLNEVAFQRCAKRGALSFSTRDEHAANHFRFDDGRPSFGFLLRIERFRLAGMTFTADDCLELIRTTFGNGCHFFHL